MWLWLILSIILLIASIVALVYVTRAWLKAEKKLAKFGQSILYKRVRNSRVYKRYKNFSENVIDKQE